MNPNSATLVSEPQTAPAADCSVQPLDQTKTGRIPLEALSLRRKQKPQRPMTLAEANALGDAIKDLAVRLDKGGITYTGIECEMLAPPYATAVDGFEVTLTEGQRAILPRKPSLSVRGALGCWYSEGAKWDDANASEIEAAGYEVNFRSI